MANLASTLLLSAGAMLNLAGMPASGSAAVDLGIDRCDAAFFEAVLPNGSTLEKVARVAEGGTFGEGASNLGYPIQPTNLPSLCAIIVNVTSSPSSSYRFGLMLPDSWNERFLAVGNGGFAGGINWLSAVSLLPPPYTLRVFCLVYYVPLSPHPPLFTHPVRPLCGAQVKIFVAETLAHAVHNTPGTRHTLWLREPVD